MKFARSDNNRYGSQIATLIGAFLRLLSSSGAIDVATLAGRGGAPPT
ncbi:hypothetical protein [Sphingopyxis sp.]|nr:hypothetical protein [Sphingopyxis sp.]MBW8296740.1 hypothetical protein [Sphingopyxis sp.]